MSGGRELENSEIENEVDQTSVERRSWMNDVAKKIEQSSWTYIVLQVMLIPLLVLMILVVRMIVIANEIPAATVFQSSVTLIGVTIAATVSFIVLRRQIRTQKEVLQTQINNQKEILQAQISAQQEREREKEIIADLKQSIKSTENIYFIIQQIDASFSNILNLLKAYKDNKEVIFDLESMEEFKKNYFREFESMKKLLDEVDIKSMPPGKMFSDFLRLKLQIELFKNLSTQLELNITDSSQGRSRAGAIVYGLEKIQRDMRNSMIRIIEEAKPMPSILQEKYKDKSMADSHALSQKIEKLFPEPPNLF